MLGIEAIALTSVAFKAWRSGKAEQIWSDILPFVSGVTDFEWSEVFRIDAIVMNSVPFNKAWALIREN